MPRMHERCMAKQDINKILFRYQMESYRTTQSGPGLYSNAAQPRLSQYSTGFPSPTSSTGFLSPTTPYAVSDSVSEDGSYMSLLDT